LKPKLKGNVVLESRVTVMRDAHEERPQAKELAQALGATPGHLQWALRCGPTCRFPNVDVVIAMNSPEFKGMKASVNVEFTAGPKGDFPDRGGSQQVYMLEKIDGHWRVTGLGTTTYDS
jgi:hypothetical protein